MSLLHKCVPAPGGWWVCQPGTGPRGGFPVDMPPVDGPWLPWSHDNAATIALGREAAADGAFRSSTAPRPRPGRRTRAAAAARAAAARVVQLASDSDMDTDLDSDVDTDLESLAGKICAAEVAAFQRRAAGPAVPLAAGPAVPQAAGPAVPRLFM